MSLIIQEHFYKALTDELQHEHCPQIHHHHLCAAVSGITLTEVCIISQHACGKKLAALPDSPVLALCERLLHSQVSLSRLYLNKAFFFLRKQDSHTFPS